MGLGLGHVGGPLQRQDLAGVLVAETLASLAILAGRTPFRYPVAELGRAWREHLRNLPHDSISGCSVDETHRAMDARFATSHFNGGKNLRDFTYIDDITRGMEPPRDATMDPRTPMSEDKRGW